MEYIFKKAQVYQNGKLSVSDLLVRGGRIAAIDREILPHPGAVTVSLPHTVIFPGFVDVHVHLREPGFSYKETMASGTMAAAHGGYAHVCPMPNLNPVPDSAAHLAEQLHLIAHDARVHVHPYGAITVGEQGEDLADWDGMAESVIGFSDDGRGVQREEKMREAMYRAKALGKIIAAHCEDNALLHGGYIHDGAYARLHGHRGICAESEWRPIARDLRLAEETGCAYHVCHISTKESVQLIREAKARGVNVTCETAPHYLVFHDMELQEDGRFKMNPPIRSQEDRQALIEGIQDGTIDMIATDHAPHSAEEKGRGLAQSAMGVVGLETAFPVCYTHLVETGRISLARLVELLHTAPMRRFGCGTPLAVGEPADLTVFALGEKWTITPEDFLSQGKASPFTGQEVFGVCKLTMIGGKIVYKENNT